MKLIGFLFLLLLGADALASVEVQIEFDKTNLSGVGINLSISNTSAEKECINSSIIGLDGAFTNIVFDIKNGNEEVDSRVIQVIQPSSQHPSLTLLPGRKVTVSLDLAADYDFAKPGNYSIRFDAWNIAQCHGKDSGIELKSNVIYFKSKGLPPISRP